MSWTAVTDVTTSLYVSFIKENPLKSNSLTFPLDEARCTSKSHSDPHSTPTLLIQAW